MLKLMISLLPLIASPLLARESLPTAPYCDEIVYETSIDAITPLGFSGSDLLALAAKPQSLDWSWEYKEGATKLNLNVLSVAQSARYVDSMAVYPNGSEESGLICSDRVEVDVWVNFASNDGAFNERWFTTLYDTDGSDCRVETGDRCLAPGREAHLDHRFDRESLVGNFYKEISLPEASGLDFYVHGLFSDTTKVKVYGQAWLCSAENNCYSYYIDGGQTTLP